MLSPQRMRFLSFKSCFIAALRDARASNNQNTTLLYGRGLGLAENNFAFEKFAFPSKEILAWAKR